jgi:hypothetical protein
VVRLTFMYDTEEADAVKEAFHDFVQVIEGLSSAA